MKNNFYEFKNKKDAISWLNNNYGKFMNQIHNTYKIDGTLGGALFSYTGSMSEDYNNILKLNNGCVENIDKVVDKYYREKQQSILKIIKDTKAEIKLIYNAFSSNYIESNIILFHYFNIDNYGIDFLNKKNFKINNFISTTLLKKVSGIKKLIHQKKYNAVFVIKVKKGTPCIPIGNNPNSCLKEYEIILKPQTELKVCGMKKKVISRIKIIIECELII